MSGTATLDGDLAPERPPLAERWAGLLVSLFFHLMVAALAVSWTVDRLRPPEPPESSVMIHFAAATPPAEAPLAVLAEEEPVVFPPTAFEEVMRTSSIGEQREERAADDSDLPDFGTPVTPPPVEAEDAPEPAESIEAEESDEGQRPALSEATRRLMARQVEAAQQQLAQQVVAETRIQGRLFAERERVRAQNADYNSQGAEEGHVREIDFNDVPFAVAQQVIERYGGRLTYGPIPSGDLEQRGPQTLNAARVGGSVLTAQHHSDGGEGYTLQAGSRLITQMVLLERQELAHRGENPSRVAITRSVFGAELSPSGWILCVKEIEYVDVE